MPPQSQLLNSLMNYPPPISRIAAILALLAVAPLAPAQQPTPPLPALALKVGDPAPRLSVGKWVKGEPVKGFEPGKVYVVECWATWCGPCKAAMPLVTALQRAYGGQGLVVVGVNVLEPDPSKVEPFVRSVGERMGYAVGIEEPIAGSPGQGRVVADWMAPAGQEGIPCSFIVGRDGRLAWVGSPFRMAGPLARIFAGTFDARAEADRQVRAEALQDRAVAAAGKQDFDGALRLVDEAAALDPDGTGPARVMRLSLVMQKGDANAANRLAANLGEVAAKERNAALAGQVASIALNGPGADRLDADVALRVAELAHELNDRGVAFQRMLAQAYAGKRRYAEAIDLQRKVVDQITGPLKLRERNKLAEYERAAGRE